LDVKRAEWLYFQPADDFIYGQAGAAANFIFFRNRVYITGEVGN
jgi:hypothetical protein